MFAFDAALDGGGTETDCTSDAAYASCLFMLELNFHSGSSIYSSQWFSCLASHTSRSNSPVAHPPSSHCRGGDGCYTDPPGYSRSVWPLAYGFPASELKFLLHQHLLIFTLIQMRIRLAIEMSTRIWEPTLST
ncbi:hypothetical protein F2Q70_00017656 [Brassica cretica]|uniref:Uncharacterized protein n=1 Tax=Brassica cretica TaxID=69181 RepID=A0A8S9HTB9_BRACR|nr:hypothetical protein F2Q70_00017656 [Brassica cretica]